MSGSRKLFQCLRRGSCNDLHMIKSKLLSVFLKKPKSILFFLHCINVSLISSESHFHRNRACSCPYIIADRIFFQLQLPKRDHADLRFCHGSFSSEKNLVRKPMGGKQRFCLVIICAHYTQRISLILCQLTGFFYKNLFIFIGQIFSHIEKHLSHSITSKLTGKLRRSVSGSQNGKHLFMIPDQRHKVAGFPMGADNLCILPGKTDFCHKIHN